MGIIEKVSDSAEKIYDGSLTTVHMLWNTDKGGGGVVLVYFVIGLVELALNGLNP